MGRGAVTDAVTPQRGNIQKSRNKNIVDESNSEVSTSGSETEADDHPSPDTDVTGNTDAAAELSPILELEESVVQGTQMVRILQCFLFLNIYYTHPYLF